MVLGYGLDYLTLMKRNIDYLDWISEYHDL